MIRNEDRVRPDRLHHLRPHHDASAPALDFDEVAIVDAELVGEPGCISQNG